MKNKKRKVSYQQAKSKAQTHRPSSFEFSKGCKSCEFVTIVSKKTIVK